MGSGSRRMGQLGSLLLLATLLPGTTAWAQGTVCHRVWVEVRDNDLMGNSEMTAPPRTRYPGKFCFIVYDRRTRALLARARRLVGQSPSPRWCCGGAGMPPRPIS